jgi:hypothetical protein
VSVAPQPVVHPEPAVASRRPSLRVVRPQREPSFDELVTGHGRHRGPEPAEVPDTLLRRLALRARLLPTPAGGGSTSAGRAAAPR